MGPLQIKRRFQFPASGGILHRFYTACENHCQIGSLESELSGESLQVRQRRRVMKSIDEGYGPKSAGRIREDQVRIA